MALFESDLERLFEIAEEAIILAEEKDLTLSQYNECNLLKKQLQEIKDRNITSKR